MAPDESTAHWVASGVVPLTGRPDGPPLLPPGRAATVAHHLGAALGTIGVDLDGPALLGERAALSGRRRRGPVSVGGSCRLLATRDGWAAVSAARPDDHLLLGALVGTNLPADPWPLVSGWLGRHTGRELRERATLLGIPAAPVRPPGTPPARGTDPGAGLRSAAGLLVVDFSALWAGPLCAHLLGLAGARVVKVETPDRPDGARFGDPSFYRLLHSGHHSVVVDPTTARGRSALADLVDAADIVVEASRARALAAFGLSAEVAVGNGAVWVSITAGGRESERVGFGDDVAAGAGLVAWDDRGPVFCGDALADPLTGLTAAVLALSVAPGTLLDLSMESVVAATIPSTSTPRAAHRFDRGEPAVGLPRARRVPDRPAPETGRDTAQVFAELGLPNP